MYKSGSSKELPRGQRQICSRNTRLNKVKYIYFLQKLREINFQEGSKVYNASQKFSHGALLDVFFSRWTFWTLTLENKFWELSYVVGAEENVNDWCSPERVMAPLFQGSGLLMMSFSKLKVNLHQRELKITSGITEHLGEREKQGRRGGRRELETCIWFIVCVKSSEVLSIETKCHLLWRYFFVGITNVNFKHLLCFVV